MEPALTPFGHNLPLRHSFTPGPTDQAPTIQFSSIDPKTGAAKLGAGGGSSETDAEAA